MHRSLKNKTALITGSVSGIGLEIARLFAQNGATVILHGMASPETWLNLKCEFKKYCRRDVHCDATDLRDLNAIRVMCENLQRKPGGIDILINNAGIQKIHPLEYFPDESWDEVLAVNLSAAFFLTKRCLPFMRENGFGRIINMASVHGLVASVNKSAYVSAKHGLIGLTKCTALETAGSGVTANAVCPGWTETDLIKKQYQAISEKEGVSIDLAKKRLLKEKQPSRQFVQSEQIAQLALFLSSAAASQITGASYTIDGGWTAR